MTGGYIDPIDCIAPKRRTTQDLPPLPPLPEQDCCTHVTDSETMDLFRADQMHDYARQCIATLKAENAEWKRIADQAHAALAENKGAVHWKSQAAAMAGLLEEAQNCIHSAGQFLKRHPATVKELMPFVEETENMWERINAALATWKGSGKDLP